MAMMLPGPDRPRGRINTRGLITLSLVALASALAGFGIGMWLGH